MVSDFLWDGMLAREPVSGRAARASGCGGLARACVLRALAAQEGGGELAVARAALVFLLCPANMHFLILFERRTDFSCACLSTESLPKGIHP
jgi:hypothetical protein